MHQRVDKVKGPILCLGDRPASARHRSVNRSQSNEPEIRAHVIGGVTTNRNLRATGAPTLVRCPQGVDQPVEGWCATRCSCSTRSTRWADGLPRAIRRRRCSKYLIPSKINTFADHYVEVDFDLSDVMFVATANSFNMPAPLLDPDGNHPGCPIHAEDERVNIAQKYLLLKQIKNNGVKDGEIDVREDAIRDIVRYYTREAGVRSLEREISKMCRKTIKRILTERRRPFGITAENLPIIWAYAKFTFGIAEKINQVGQVNGLA